LNELNFKTRAYFKIDASLILYSKKYRYSDPLMMLVRFIQKLRTLICMGMVGFKNG